MEAETIQATFLRLYLRDFMERVKFRGERFIVQTFGRPMMVLISYEDYLLIKNCLPPASRTLELTMSPRDPENVAEPIQKAL
ncbi:MAG: hypothetical protein IT331_10425 [Anaerolineae bacterium]|nr:hypothetical protein [Anaerolineae bacterium]